MLKVAVVDDEEDVALNTAEFIRRYGEENGREFEIKIYHDGMDIVSLSELPDIIFLDIEMKNLDGMRAAKEIRKRDENCVILFVTRMAQYAVEGYEVNALDFIVKPFTRQSFFYKFGRAVKAADKNAQRTILVSSNGGKYKLLVSDILYVEVVNHKVQYHLVGGTIEVWDSLKSVCEKLGPCGFALCNACYLVNLRKVRSYEGGFVVVGGEKLKMSRQKKESFLNELAKFLC